jgi:hypothetical protein
MSSRPSAEHLDGYFWASTEIGDDDARRVVEHARALAHHPNEEDGR